MFISPNVDTERSCNNYYKVISGQRDANGTYYATIKEIYDKVFEPSWQEFQSRQRPSRRFDATYLEYIRYKKTEARSKTTDERYKDKALNEAYEVVFQIGSRMDTAITSYPDDFEKANLLLRKVCDKICELPYVVTITDKELSNPDWIAPENALIIANLCVHADEVCPGIHLTFIPCCTSQRGTSKQALLKQTFKALGYDTVYEIGKDEEGNPIRKKDKNNNIIVDSNGNPIYKKTLVKKGALDWLEDIKNSIAIQMKAEYDWDRAKTVSGRSHLEIEDYKIYAKKIEQERLNTKIFETQDWLSNYSNELFETVLQNETRMSDLFYMDSKKLWEEYNRISSCFWEWYKMESQNLKDSKMQMLNLQQEYEQYQKYLNDLIWKSNNLILILIQIIVRFFSKLRMNYYKDKLDQIIKKQKELKETAKKMSSETYKARNSLKDNIGDNEMLESLSQFEKELKEEYESSQNMNIEMFKNIL